MVVSKIKYRCPRCKGEKLQIHVFYIKCRGCGLEFDKRDIINFDEEDVLALSEKEGIIRVLQESCSEKLSFATIPDPLRN